MDYSKGSPLRARFDRMYRLNAASLKEVAVDANAAFVALAELRPELFEGYISDTFDGRGILIFLGGQVKALDLDRWVDNMIAQRDRLHPEDLRGL